MTAFSDALRAGDVERLCRPNGVFTAAVVRGMNSDGESCESSVELSTVIDDPPPLQVTGVDVSAPDLATVTVQIAGGETIPLDLVREGRRWLVSFSDGIVPITAIAQHR